MKDNKFGVKIRVTGQSSTNCLIWNLMRSPQGVIGITLHEVNTIPGATA